MHCFQPSYTAQTGFSPHSLLRTALCACTSLLLNCSASIVHLAVVTGARVAAGRGGQYSALGGSDETQAGSVKRQSGGPVVQ